MSIRNLTTLVQKLESLRRTNKGLLDFTSPKIRVKEEELKEIVNDASINPYSFTTVALYLQNVNLSKFTTEELKLMLSFDYSSLENTNVNLISINDFDLLEPPVDFNKQILDAVIDEDLINTAQTRLLSVNKNKSLNFFINYIISQI